MFLEHDLREGQVFSFLRFLEKVLEIELFENI